MSPFILLFSVATAMTLGAAASAQPIPDTHQAQPAVRNAPTQAELAAPLPNTISTPTIEEVREGSRVFDTQGALVGTVETVDENGAIVATGHARARVPFSSFGRNGRGLVISMTKSQLEAAVAARSPS